MTTLTIKTIKKGTVIHYNGIPMELTNDIEVVTTEGNYQLSQEKPKCSLENTATGVFIKGNILTPNNKEQIDKLQDDLFKLTTFINNYVIRIDKDSLSHYIPASYDGKDQTGYIPTMEDVLKVISKPKETTIIDIPVGCMLSDDREQRNKEITLTPHEKLRFLGKQPQVFINGKWRDLSLDMLINRKEKRIDRGL